MASINKKKKAKNSYIYNSGEKLDGRYKRIFYFTKRDRIRNNKINMDEFE